MDEWNGGAVRLWLERRVAASQTEQVRAERGGRDYEDDYDKAAAEEWVCRQALRHPSTGDQAEFLVYLKSLLARDEYSRTGVYNDRRFEREVKACLRKVMKMAKANEGFAKTSHFQRD